MADLKLLSINKTDSGALPLPPPTGSACGSSSCCSGGADSLEAWIIGKVETPAGPIPQIATAITTHERWEHVRCRISSFRNNYKVPPRLYAVGNPDSSSDVIVTANYKLTFDAVRQELAGLNLWILVLDTKGINVWCAAGKGIFGTDELVGKIRSNCLNKVVSHRRVIVPQLGAVGVSGYKVIKQSGFRVVFGPVYARDIEAFIGSGYQATPEMRRITFTFRERLELAPMELNPAFGKYPHFALIMLFLFGLQPQGIIFKDALWGAAPFLILGLLAILSGAFLVPVLLPFIPFRSFALKGLFLGSIMTTAFLMSSGMLFTAGIPATLAALVFFPLASSYLALQFTGSTTYTSMSGVRKELRIALPACLAGTGFAIVLLLVSKLRMWGVV